MKTTENQKTQALDLSKKAQQLFTEFAVQESEDANFFAVLLEEFNDQIDVMMQLKLFHAWCLDQHPNKIKNPRFRFRSWLANAAEYRNKKRITHSPALYTKKTTTEASTENS